MDELLTAIYAYFTSATGNTLGALLGARTNMFPGTAPIDAVAPFITYSVVGNSDDDSNASTILRPVVSFTAWDTNRQPDAAWAVAVALRTLYADALLTLVTWKTIRAQIQQPGISLWDDESEYWGITVDILYEIGI